MNTKQQQIDFEKARRLFETKVVPVPESGCWLAITFSYPFDYGHMTVNGQYLHLHRWSWMLHRGPIPKGMHVLHKCDTPQCSNPDHLFLGTAKDNHQDAKRKGRHPGQKNFGDNHSKAVLTSADVIALRAMPNPISYSALARKFGVSRQSLTNAVIGKTWKNVPMSSRRLPIT